MRRCSVKLVLLGLLMGVVPSCGSSSNNSDDSGTGADTATNTDTASSTQGNTGTQTASSSSNSNSSSFSTLNDATVGSVTTSTAGINNGSSSSNTGGGGTGSATATSDSTSGGAGEGGSGGDPRVTCPSEPPSAGSACSFAGPLCAYEDCDGVGRQVATCSEGAWFIDSGPCSETVYCNGGSEMCAPGEICLIRAGGAFLQECWPNTCEGEAVDCSCIDGCFDNCPLFATVEGGITITCNTCPSGQCP